MNRMLEVLRSIAVESLEPFWLPLGAWTVVAVAVLLIVWLRDLHPLVRYRTDLALLLALPSGMLVATLLEALAPAPGSGSVTFVSPEVYLLTLPPVPTPASPDLSLYHLLGGLLVVFAGVSVWRTVATAADAVRLARFRRRLDLVEDAAGQREVDEMARAFGISRRVRLLVSERDVVPMTFGWLRPQVILPRAVLSITEARRMVLAHELVHVRRHDYAFHWMERAVAALFSLHPLVLLLERRLLASREMACDAEVLRDDAFSPRRYADLLFSLLPQTAPVQRHGMAMADARNIKRRILAMKTLTRFNRAPAPRAGAALIAVLVLCAGTVAAVSAGKLAGPASSPPDAPRSDTLLAAAADTNIFVVVDQMPDLIDGFAGIQQNLRYPESAKEAGIEGKVIVQFVVDAAGKVVNPVITRGVDPALDEAALDAVRNLRFNPGRQGGTAVNVQMSLPIMFRLAPEEPSDDVKDGIGDTQWDGVGDTQWDGTGDAGGDERGEQDAATEAALRVVEPRQTEAGVMGRAHSPDGKSRPAAEAVVVADPGTSRGAVTDGQGRFELRRDDLRADPGVREIRSPGYPPAVLPSGEEHAAESPSSFTLLGALFQSL